ncbi:MAG: hypothetical protein GY773_28820 [Actinomycetia bacterium]|nr:hypothetical protein [Actinomycetes bacterium]
MSFQSMGGGSGGGHPGGTTLSPAIAPPSTPAATPATPSSAPATTSPFVQASAEVTTFADWRELVTERFPGWAWALDHPELGPLLETAAEDEFTVDTFNAQLRATDWFTSRTESQRSWDIFSGDPANATELADQVHDQTANLRAMAGQLGLELSEDFFATFAESVLRNNLSESEVIGGLIASASDITFGSFTAAEAAVRATADRFLINVDAETARTMATKLLDGTMNEDGVTEYMKGVALQRFPSLEADIMRGVDLSEYFAPHRNLMADMLGIAPVSIDMANDPRFMSVLSFGDGDTIRPMTLAETGRYTRTLDDYWSTPGGAGESEMFGFLSSLSKTMGTRR